LLAANFAFAQDIDEKKFSKKLGYQTTLVNLQKYIVYDITLGRTESNLGKYLQRLPDRSNCKLLGIFAK